MEYLPSVCARRPQISGRKSGYVERQFFGGLSPLRGPSATVAAEKEHSEIVSHSASAASRAAHARIIWRMDTSVSTSGARPTHCGIGDEGAMVLKSGGYAMSGFSLLLN